MNTNNIPHSQSHIYSQIDNKALPTPSGPYSKPLPFEASTLTRILDNHDHDVRQSLYQLFQSNPLFHLQYGLSLEQERKLCVDRWIYLSNTLNIFKDTITSDKVQDATRYDAITEVCGILDHSLEVLMGVHYGLFGSSIAFLGSQKQRDAWLHKVEQRTMIGCFGLTELGHGSNVRGMETTAVYHHNTQNDALSYFIINTPKQTAQKYWIGGAATNAKWCAVFAQLFVNGTHHGIHPFIVQLRLEHNDNTCENVFIKDCGHKWGLNGVDNGRIWFRNVRVPKSAMLGAFSHVDKSGVFQSNIKDPDQRFAAMLLPLTGGRVSIANGAMNRSKIGLATAVRYAASRKAFAPSPTQPEVPILYYQSHQQRLIPYVAATLVMNFCTNHLKFMWRHRQQYHPKQIHVFSSGFKAIMTWHMRDTLQACREACGGQGYKSENRIAPIKSDHDIYLTYEGDNLVLLHRVTQAILTDFTASRNDSCFTGSLLYLNHLDPNTYSENSVVPSEDILIRILATRVLKTLQNISAKLTALKKQNIPSFDAWNSCLDLAYEAGRAHIEYIIATTSIQQIKEKTKHDLPLHDMLLTCRRLYLFNLIDTQSIFLKLSIISPAQANIIHDRVLTLCQYLAQHAVPLVDTFGIPQHLLGPIAYDWVHHNALEMPLLSSKL